jgi:hypothetical protein
LIVDQKGLSPILKDERLTGINYQSDPFGGFTNSPLISDTQDEAMRDQLISMGLLRKDAEHLTQAICNGCDYFLTRDKRTIVIPYREEIERQYPIKIRMPLELVEELKAIGILARA